MVWRKQSEVYHVRLAADEAAAFERAANGRSLACVCEAFAERPDPVRAAFQTLSNWFWEGWIAAP